MAQDDYNEQEMELLKDKRKLKYQQKEQELAHQDEIRTICMVRSTNCSIEAKYICKRYFSTHLIY
jgi:hypothetical protein